MPPRAAILFLAATLICRAQEKKPVTIEALVAPPRAGMQAVWAPDGSRFAYTERGELWIYDVASRGAKRVLALAELEKKAVAPAPPAAFEWQNRRATEQAVQWFPSGREMLVASRGDLFLVRVDPGTWEQLTATAEPERDPKPSPDGRFVSFRRGRDLYCMEIAGRKVTRLTQGGSSTLLHAELDWVYPEELDLGTAYWWAPDSRRIAFLELDVSREAFYPQVNLQSATALFEPQRFPQPGRQFQMVDPQRTHAVTGAIRKHLLETMAEFFEKNL